MAISEHTGLEPVFTPFVVTMYFLAVALALGVFSLLYWKDDVLAAFGMIWPYLDRAFFFL
jgi:hypothetical protein